MTYHSHLAWDFEQEVVDKVIEEVVVGLKYNRAYNNDKCYTPDAYITFNVIDTLIYEIGKFLDVHEDQEPIADDAVDRFLQIAPESGKTVTRRVLIELQKWVKS